MISKSPDFDQAMQKKPQFNIDKLLYYSQIIDGQSTML